MLRNVLAISGLLGSFSAFPGASIDYPNGLDLMRRSLAAGEANEELLRSYVSRAGTRLRQFDGDGNLKSDEVKTYDDVEVDGFHVRALVEKDGKPLDAADRQKEESRIAKLVAQRKRETPAQRQKRIAEAKEKREKDRSFSHELLQAFDYKVAGEEIIRGRKTWVLDASPHPGYKAREIKAQIFSHLRGRLWLDQQDLLWAKADASAFEPFTAGFSVVLKLDEGARLFFEQIRLPDSAWVVTRTGLKANARIALVKHIAIESETSFSNFRKVPPDNRLPDAKEMF